MMVVPMWNDYNLKRTPVQPGNVWHTFSAKRLLSILNTFSCGYSNASMLLEEGHVGSCT